MEPHQPLNLARYADEAPMQSLAGSATGVH
jgi:hypothetical protein